MVPKGWGKNSLDSLFEFKNGLNTEKEQYGNGYKFVNVMDVFRNDILTESKIIGRVQVTDKQLEGYQLKYGDVLFNRTSETFDEIAIAAIYLDNAIATFGGFVIRARPKGNQIDPAYSVFLFQSKSYRSQVVKLGQGAIRANIGQKDLARVCILVPPLAEQKKIAQILSTWDKAISVTEKLLTNSQQQKKALMQQLLTGKKRLLDENGVRFSGEWEYTIFGNLGDTYTGLTGKTKEDFGAGKPYIPYINIFKNSRIDIQNLEYVQVNDDERQSVVKYGDIFFTTSSETPEEVGMSSVLLEEVSEVFLNSFCFGFRLNNFETLIPKYARYLFRSEHVRRQISTLGQGVTRYNLSKRQLIKLELKLPCVEEQQKIAAVLSAADAEISTLEKKLTCLRDEKKALMQQLLTGKRRVKVDEAVAE
ncbi:restriction endonuclease subunit S [Escherichia coli]|uniref:restriction endonuclease subunit S n=1 Tax=Escherichia coli TaxID=562 RepID=UPI00184752F3|nr:restriction endonuclease subunit S [Escherichia coli]EFU8317640.1 restriction endonuclease subunit S [Escherichia coli]EIP0523723.1 restriction endonuclease subunit S [Escherichia coli]EKM4482355.1 restriction endonuclease subunit S [Escherichia coli]ELX1725380.1 restriction endonuclease subunit S [Escherichia coli]